MGKIGYSLRPYKSKRGDLMISEHPHNVCRFKKYIIIGSVVCDKCKYQESHDYRMQTVECKLVKSN